MKAKNSMQMLRNSIFAGLLAMTAHNVAASPVKPTLDLWGTEAFSADCGPTSCGNKSGFSLTSTTANFHKLRADNSLSNAGNAVESHALLTASTGLSLPQLTAKASGPLLAEGIASAIGTYSYSGPNVTKTLNATLSGSILNPNNSPLTNIKIGVAIFDALTLESAVTSTTPGAGFQELAAVASSLAFGKTVKLSRGTPKPLKTLLLTLTATGSKSGNIALSLVNGQSFYIVTSLLVEAGKGGTADALHTFKLSFNNNSGLSSPNSVPVPSAIWLFGSAGLGVFPLYRRRA